MKKDFMSVFKEKVDFIIDQGLTIEIKDCFKSEKNIESFTVKIIDNKTYWISIKLRDYSKQEIRRIFSEFVDFIQYSYATLYIRDDYDNGEMYKFLSIDKNMTGFYCELIFS